MSYEKYQRLEEIGKDSTGLFMTGRSSSDQKMYQLKLIQTDENEISAKAFFAIQYKAQQFANFSHPNVIPFYEPELTPQGLLLRQNFTPGISLYDFLSDYGRPMALAQAIKIADNITAALAAMHDQKLVLEKLDSSHILISDSGDGYLSLLSLPSAFDSRLELYHEPNAGEPGRSQFSADVYAMGVILVELFTSLTPYGIAGGGEIYEAYAYYETALSRNQSETPTEIVEIIRRCLSPDPAVQFMDGIDLFNAIRQKSIAAPQTQSDEQTALTLDTAPGTLAADPGLPKPQPAEAAPFESFSRSQRERRRSSAAKRAEKDRKPAPPFRRILPLIGVVVAVAAGFGLIFNFSKSAEVRQEEENYRATLEMLHSTQTALSGRATEKALIAAWTETPTPTMTLTPSLTPSATPVPITRAVGSALRWEQDQSEMVFVPAGKFQMGMDHTFLYNIANLLPRYEVEMDAFWIDREEVNQKQYADCVQAGGCEAISGIQSGLQDPDYPIIGATWEKARAYCVWAGKRLPSEAEWEKAARGSDGRLYPWGNFSPAPEIGAEIAAGGSNAQDISPYGAFDMAGNVSEWVNDYFSETWTIATEPRNPVGPVSGFMRTLKGGNVWDDTPEVRFLFRRQGSAPANSRNYGFRCAVSDPLVTAVNAAGLAEPVPVAAALGYDPNPADCSEAIGFGADITIPDGTILKSGETVTKTWVLKNIGTCTIHPDYKIVWTDTSITNEQKLFDFNTTIAPGQEGEVSFSFQVQGNGPTRISFQLANSDGAMFGLGARGIGALWIDYIAE